MVEYPWHMFACRTPATMHGSTERLEEELALVQAAYAGAEVFRTEADALRAARQLRERLERNAPEMNWLVYVLGPEKAVGPGMTDLGNVRAVRWRFEGEVGS